MKKSTIVYINYDTVVEIFKQINMITTFTNKLNFRLIKAFNYIQRFDLKLRHKLNKTYIVLNALFRLISDNIVNISSNEELNVLFIITVIDFNEVFRKKILDDYDTNLN